MFFRFQGPLLKYRKLFWSTIVQTIKARILTKLTVDRVPCSPSLYVYFLYEIHQMSILAKCLLLPNVPFVKCPRPLFSFSPRYLFSLSLSLSLSIYLSIYLSNSEGPPSMKISEGLQVPNIEYSVSILRPILW